MAIKIKVVNMIPRSLSSESRQDAEPNLTVNPSNPQQIVGTAFTPDPAGGPNAPIYVSSDGGDTWALNAIVPGGNAFVGTGDITPRFSSKALYAGDIRGDSALLAAGCPLPFFRVTFNVLRTPDALSPVPMTVLESRCHVDQPFVEATTVVGGPDAGKDRVYVGNNDFGAPGGKTATVDRSLDAFGAAVFDPLRIETRATMGQNGPSVRTAIHRDGTVYAAFFGWRAGVFVTTDVVVVRDDVGAAGPGPFTALTDPGDLLPGMRVVTGRSIIWNQLLAQQRTGSSLTIAVDPNNSSTVYLAWCDQQAGGYTLHVRRSTDRGVNWSGADLLTVERATNPALAINNDGKVGLVYQQVFGLNPTWRWETHLRLTNDGVTWNDYVLANTPASTPVAQYWPYLGDYIYLTALERDFYGIFSANNTPDMANFPQGVKYQREANFATHTLLGLGGAATVPVSIDPFFFKVTEEAREVVSEGGGVSCAVEPPETRPECVSPAAPPWLPFSQCIYWYETRFVRQFPFVFRIVYQHCARLLGRQQGPLLYTITLLPGEVIKLYHYERYRRTRAAKDTYSIHTSWRTYTSAAHRSRSLQSTSDYQKFLTDVAADGDTSITVGGQLFPISWSVDDFDSANMQLLRTASVDRVNEQFHETLSIASQQVDTERSVVVSTFEDAETRDVTSRTIKNDNDCRAVTYFVRRVNEAYELTTRVYSVDKALFDRQKKTLFAMGIHAAPQWHALNDMQSTDEKTRESLKPIIPLLPKVGDVIQSSQPITLPTDGAVYEAELAHCASCEPEKIAAIEIALEKAKAEALKACCETNLCELEVQRRRLLLENGQLEPFGPSNP